MERVEILRDLRLGVFDVLVGINLLREGLDLPEVSLVAILDADKEGFLRSERSLIQTIGRAARHIHGKAILYADKMTGSILRALAETNRRRHIQKQYNIDHHITPKSIEKKVHDFMEGAYGDTGNRAKPYLLNEINKKYQIKSEKDIEKNIKRLEKQMLKHAQNLEFEEAANIRDDIKQLNKAYN